MIKKIKRIPNKIEKDLNKERVLELLETVHDNAEILAFEYIDDTYFRNSHKFLSKCEIVKIVNNSSEVFFKKRNGEVDLEHLIIGDRIGIATSNLYTMQQIQTDNTDGFTKKSLSNARNTDIYYVFFKVDEDSSPKKITLKLGDKEKTLDLIEGTDWAIRYFNRKEIHCTCYECFKKDFLDNKEYGFDDNFVRLGRKVLGFFV